MLTSHCQHCGAPKTPDLYSSDYCKDCQTVIDETREFVTRENTAREAANKKIIDEHKADLESGKLSAADAGLKPLIDPSAARKEALTRRNHALRSGDADPRAPFDPGLRDARYNNLGMGAKVSPNLDVHRA